MEDRRRIDYISLEIHYDDGAQRSFLANYGDNEWTSVYNGVFSHNQNIIEIVTPELRLFPDRLEVHIQGWSAFYTLTDNLAESSSFLSGTYGGEPFWWHYEVHYDFRVN